MGSEALVQYVEHLSAEADEDQGQSPHGHPAGTDGGDGALPGPGPVQRRAQPLCSCFRPSGLIQPCR